MKDDFLSQEEVDALLKKNQAINGDESADDSENQPKEVEEKGLNESDKDVIGEVGNISMSTAGNT
ncbi:MAG TPA: flagellar motor switch phosphatase FliY, partial [Eubacteriaceae bacterium]|nr:flagellar motor switch phosphatase FliY [Eubacteriaceae bacterium]